MRPPYVFPRDSTLTLVGRRASLEACRQSFGTTYPMKSLEWYAWSVSILNRINTEDQSTTNQFCTVLSFKWNQWNHFQCEFLSSDIRNSTLECIFTIFSVRTKWNKLNFNMLVFLMKVWMHWQTFYLKCILALYPDPNLWLYNKYIKWLYLRRWYC